MRVLMLAFGFSAAAVSASAQSPRTAPAQNSEQQSIAPGLDAAIRRSLLPGAKGSEIPWSFMRPRARQRTTALQPKCAIRLLEAPVRNDVDYAMRIQRAPKNIDQAIAARPPAPACPDR